MMLQEFNDLAAKKDKGPVCIEEYNMIESVYMGTNLSKEDMVDLYFNHISWFNNFETLVRIKTNLEDELKAIKSRLGKINALRPVLDKALIQLNLANETINKESKLD